MNEIPKKIKKKNGEKEFLCVFVLFDSVGMWSSEQNEDEFNHYFFIECR